MSNGEENTTGEQRWLSVSRILVTGANRFVGQALCRALSGRYEVLACARKHANLPADVKQHINPVVDASTDWSQSLREIDVVMHLAAHVHAQNDLDRRPELFTQVNLDATVNLARQAASAGIKRFVYLSTVKVHGEETTARSFTESDAPMPAEPYAMSKLAAERALMKIGRETGMAIVVIRSPLVYGPGVKANFYQLLELVRRVRFLPLAAIRNRRSLIFLGNLIDCLTLCATHPAAKDNIYLVSDVEDVSTPRLAQLLANAMHRPQSLFALPLSWMKAVAWLVGKSSAMDRLTQSLAVDSTKIRNELGWKSSYTLQQGLQITVDWYLHSKQRMHSS